MADPGGGELPSWALPSPDARTAVVVVLAFVGAGLANAVGIGGGALFTPLFRFGLGMSLRQAAVASQASGEGAGLRPSGAATPPFPLPLQGHVP